MAAGRNGVLGVDDDEDSSEPLFGVFNADLRNFVTVLNEQKKTLRSLSLEKVSHSVKENGKSHADRYELFE